MPGEPPLPKRRDENPTDNLVEYQTRTPGLSDFESTALVQVAAQAMSYSTGTTAPYYPPDASEDDKREADERRQKMEPEEEVRRRAALDKFGIAVNERLAKAYYAGENAAVDRADRNNFNARSITLYLVVLAVVAMPVVAMIIKLSPQAFGSYIAPMTGIASTVVGYRFGAVNRPGKYSDSAR